MALVDAVRTACGSAAWLALAGCWATPSPTVPGPESPELLERVHGTVLVSGDWTPHDELDVYVLSRGIHRKIELDHDFFWFSNADEHGRFVYERRIRSFWTHEERFELYLASIDGTPERRIRSTTAGLHRVALSRSGRHVAFVEAGDTGNRLHVLDLETQKDRGYPGPSSGALQWLDGERALVHSVSVRREDVPEDLRPCVPPIDALRPNGEVSVVQVFDLESGVDRPLCVGAEPTPIPGRFEIAVAELETGKVSVVDAKDGRRIREWTPVPGWNRESYWDHLLGAFDSDLAMYVGLPTSGAEQRSYIPGNPLFREMMSTIKVADLSTGKFVTVVPHVRPLTSTYAPWEPSFK